MFWEKQFGEFAERLRSDRLPLAIRLWNGDTAVGCNPSVVISVPSFAALRHLLDPSLENLGRAYVEGKIEVEGRLHDLIAVGMRLAACGKARARWAHLPHFPHAHRRYASALARHHEVSNEFYSLWLDRNMVYSCGYFRTDYDSIDLAQIQKIDHVLGKLHLRSGDRLLDIGCGWGTLVMRAAEKFGAIATGITLSENQCRLARERIAAAGLADRCDVRVQDYREVTGKFDRITSVGMFEHVGLSNLRTYFEAIHRLLADDGVVLNHGISSGGDAAMAKEHGASGFMDSYVFPDTGVPHISLTLSEMCAAGLEPTDVENLRRHYAATLHSWAERFERHGARLRTIAGEKHYRMWRLHLAGCAYGFAQNWMTLHQILAVKKGSTALPLTRDYMYAERATADAAIAMEKHSNPARIAAANLVY